MVFECTNNYYPIFNFRTYYEEVTDLLSEHFKNNLKEIFIQQKPDDFVKMYRPIFVASIFASKESKEKIVKQANDLLKEKTSWLQGDLKLQEFVKVGWKRFIKFFDMKVEEMNLTDDETAKAKEFSDFIKGYPLDNI